MIVSWIVEVRRLLSYMVAVVLWYSMDAFMPGVLTLFDALLVMLLLFVLLGLLYGLVALRGLSRPL